MMNVTFLFVFVMVLVTIGSASKLFDGVTIFEDVLIERIDPKVKNTKVNSHRLGAPSLASPAFAPTASPTTPEELSAVPTFAPTLSPTDQPTEVPTESPTAAPTAAPSAAPTAAPSATPSATPTAAPTTATPSFVPTFSPTPVPSVTPVPTAPVDQGVLIKGDVSAIGSTAEQFNSDPNNGITLGKAIDQLTGLPSGTTAVGDAVCIVCERRRLMSTASTTSTIRIPYSIKMGNTKNFGYPNADSAFTSITTVISTSAADQSLTSTMQSIAVASNVTLLITLVINGSAVDTSSFTVLSTDHDRTLVTDGEIAGIVIGSLVGVAIVAVLVYYYLRQRREDLKSGDDDKYESRPDVFRNADEPLAITNGNGANDTSLVASSDYATRV